MRALNALMRLGGSGTTAQVHGITGSMAVHQDIFSLRCWLQFVQGYGVEDTKAAVLRENLGANETGAEVVRYTLREDVRELHRRLRPKASDKSDRSDAGPPAPLTRRAHGAVQVGAVAQAVFWDMHARTPEEAAMRKGGRR